MESASFRFVSRREAERARRRETVRSRGAVPNPGVDSNGEEKTPRRTYGWIDRPPDTVIALDTDTFRRSSALSR
ncbi:hypothetical protein BRC68_05690 [Halobacteriales archaeon QH_6_64_20]|nr:MAG: hypothetical protein BRC68_05690 [Halobacteriales archaeon QH_6_64_20]